MPDLSDETDPRLEEDLEGGGEIDGICITVPDGEYEVRYDFYETAILFGTPKVIVHCAIVSPEEYGGVPIDRYYTVDKLKGPAARYGRYVGGRHRSLVREFRLLFDDPVRRDRISFARLKDRRLIVRVRTVVRDYDHRELPIHDQYSVIEKLLSVLPDDAD